MITPKRTSKIEVVKALKTWIFFTASSGNLNKFVLQTWSKCHEINTNVSLCQIRNTHKRGPKIESIKACKTRFFFTAAFGNLNKFVLETCFKCYEKNTTWSLYQIRMNLERAQVFELIKLPKSSVWFTEPFEKFNKFVLWSNSTWLDFSTTQGTYQIRNVCQKLSFLEMYKWGN